MPQHPQLQVPNQNSEDQRKAALGAFDKQTKGIPSNLRNKFRSQFEQQLESSGQLNPNRGFSPAQQDLAQFLQGTINQGGIGATPEQLERQFLNVSQGLQPGLNAALTATDQDAAARGIFRSGIPLEDKNRIRLQHARILAQASQDLQFRNEQQRRQSVIAAIQMLQFLNANAEDLFQLGVREDRASQNQATQSKFNLIGTAFRTGLGFLTGGPPGAAAGLVSGIASGSRSEPVNTSSQGFG